KRKVEKKLVRSIIVFKGLTLQKIGEKMKPPVKKAAVSRLLNEKDEYKSEKRINEIAKILGIPAEILFPYK
ncbi:MAG: hypothetical protein U9N38_04970, partial [Thermodesulfobacteriota bacterium]|nr:hypothetical protein [Thermodesulfobacteriota bacterium]